MFVIGKLLTIVLLPTAFMVICAAAGLLLRRWLLGRILLAAGVGALALCLLLPVDDWVDRPLEDRFPQLTDPPARVDGIVLLGGAIDDVTSKDRNTPTLTSAGNRITSFVQLARRYPDARLVFTGGSGALEQGVANEADYTRILLDQLGIPPTRVLFEDRSRTTRENAVLTQALVHPQPGQTWLLVTSAVHMPRAIGVFRAIGWDMTAWPVGYQTRDHLPLWQLSLGTKLAALDAGAHEWMGLLAYWLRGWTPALYPAPRLPAAS